MRAFSQVTGALRDAQASGTDPQQALEKIGGRPTGGPIGRLLQQMQAGGAPGPGPRGSFGRIGEMIRQAQAGGASAPMPNPMREAPRPMARPGTGTPPSVSPQALAQAATRMPMTKPGMMKKGGAVKSASKRADGIAQRGKTKGRVI